MGFLALPAIVKMGLSPPGKPHLLVHPCWPLGDQERSLEYLSRARPVWTKVQEPGREAPVAAQHGGQSPTPEKGAELPGRKSQSCSAHTSVPCPGLVAVVGRALVAPTCWLKMLRDS